MHSALKQILIGALIAVTAVSCRPKEQAAKGMPMAQLLQAGTCPVEVSGLSRSIGPVPAFQVTLRNLSDRKVDSIRWTVLVFKGDGSLVDGGKGEGGYGEYPGIAPGSAVQGMFPAGSDAAATARLVIRDIVYTDKVMDMEIAKKWSNANHDAEVQKVLGKR